MPLHVVRTLHPRTEFGRPAPVMPQIKVGKIDRLIERRSSHHPRILKRLNDLIALHNPCIDGLRRRIRSLIKFRDKVLVMAGDTDTLHPAHIGFPIRTASADRLEEEPR